MQKSEGFLLLLAKAVPVGAGSLEEGEGADDIRLDELSRTVDGAVDVGLSRKVDDGAGAVLGEKFGDEFGIADIAANEGMLGIPLKVCEVLEIPCVGELVEVDDGILLECDPIEDEVGTDESGAAGDDDGGHD